ncbi:MAG: hypothetical protein JAY94_11000 [Candidatus Thiodiazotropha endolucinida]|nr:hypothetical protein [Candidatus Thiodiazotropha taylori]MCW4318034.1 hypothetical protein [Candidatus Thiodiazotropha taylori]
MNLKEITILLVVGLLLGFILIAILSDKRGTLTKVENWSIAFGSGSLAIAILLAALDIQKLPVKLAISFIFFGVPAFSAGIVMKACSVFCKTKKEHKNGNA